MRKTIRTCCLALVCSISMAEDKPELSISGVTRNVYCVTHAYPWAANSLIAVMDDKTLVRLDGIHGQKRSAKGILRAV